MFKQPGPLLWLEGAEFKAEHAIVKVLKHEIAPEQQNLLLPPRDGGNGGS